MFTDRDNKPPLHAFSKMQRVVLGLMTGLVCLTFLMTNLQALLWQSSDWLVSTVLPAVVVDLTNTERAELAAPQLRRNATLDEAARLKAEHMAANEYFSHYSPNGVSPWYWFNEVAYIYAHAGENLAIHFTDSSQVVEAWMNSPTHRDNIVNSLYTEIGVGTAKGTYDGYDTVYVVQLFGTPAAPTPPVVEPAAVAVVTPAATQNTQPSATLPSDTDPLLAEVQVNEIVVVQPPAAAEPSSVVLAESESVVVSPDISFTETVEQSPEVAMEPAETVVLLDSATPVTLLPRDVVVVTKPLLATSSGLAIATIEYPHATHAGATVASVATRPHQVLQFMYFAMALITLVLIVWSVVHEARRLHYVQVVYGLLLLLLMGGLWFVHGLLTTGAVIA